MNERIKIYRYYFDGKKHPLTITAYNRVQARHKLSVGILPYLNNLDYGLLGETVTVPIENITTKIVDEIEYVWVGLQNSKDGWQKK